MNSVHKIIKSRQQRTIRSRSRFIQRSGRLALLVGIIFSVVISLSIITFGLTISNISQFLPSLEILPLLLNPPNGKLLEPTSLYDRSGEHVIAVLAYKQARDKKYLPVDEDLLGHIPRSLVQATVIASDPDFWTHKGSSWNLSQLEKHPTLAQKLIVENLLWDEQPSFQRAFTERILAAQITSEYGREKILEWFINSTKYGDFVFGADAAARIYFGKSASKLNLAESAAIAAAAQFPDLNLLETPQSAANAKDSILALMYQQRLISSSEYNDAVGEKLSLHQTDEFLVDKSPVFTRLVLDQVGGLVPLERVVRGGLQIVTTLDYELQSQAECTLSTQLDRISNSSQSESLMENCDMARLLPSQQVTDMPEGFSASANIVMLDPRNGQILSIASSDEALTDLNQTFNHPPGLILTPFIYLTSFSQGMSPGTMVWDTSAALPDGFSEIQNPDGIFHGPTSLRTALTNDYIVPTLQILSQVDPNQVWHSAQQLGLRTIEIPAGEGSYLLPLEGGQASLLELSQAYGVFAAEGILAGITRDRGISDNGSNPVLPQVVLKIMESSGELWLDCTNQLTDCPIVKKPVVSPQLAYLITHSLSDESSRWPSLGHPNQLEIGRPAGAKIGRTIPGDDTWTIGYTPSLVVGVWMGLEGSDVEFRNFEGFSAGLWHALIQYASKDQPIEEFKLPPGITVIKVCYPSGLLPTEDCPRQVEEVFTFGNEPTQIDNLYKAFLINRETDQLATIFTPPAFVEEKVFMVVPPEHEIWARDANIPTIPKSYDILDPVSPSTSDVSMTSPEMFNAVKGHVQIRGRATGEGFNHYRLQFGAGLNPKTWFQIGDDVYKPVQNGTLGIWDTAELSGLYALQLLVVYEDQHVESTIIQLTVDNQPPQVSIRFPADGQEFLKGEFNLITFQVDGSDNLELNYLEFILDGDILTRLSTTPYAVPWKVTPGKHLLKVRAFDRAGNSSETSVEFVIGD